MSDDPLLDAVGAAMNEEETAIDAQLEKYAHGTLSAEERAVLDKRIADDPEFAQKAELFAALSADTHQKLRSIATAASAPPAKPRVWPRVFAGSSVVLALAAAAILYVQSAPQIAPLPSYALRARAGDAEFRSEAAPESRTVRADSQVEIVLTPSERVTGELQTALFVRVDGKSLVPPVTPEISQDGAVRWRGRADQMGMTDRGEVQWIAIVGRRGTLPDADEAARAKTGNGWQAATLEVLIRPLAGP